MDLQELKQKNQEVEDAKAELRDLLGEDVKDNPASGSDASAYDDLIGKPIGIRTVTFSQVGRLTAVTDKEFVLEDAACIMDWGRFAGGAGGDVSEVEPYPDGKCIVSRGAFVDVFPFGGDLPLSQK